MKAQWIWGSSPQPDEYYEFIDTFFFTDTALLRISADSNYAVYLNGDFVSCGQYPDYPYDKIYDEIDLTSFCRAGENQLRILAWFNGNETSSTYYPGTAGLLYEISGTDCFSDATTLARISPAYISHRKQPISSQLGWSYRYDSEKEDEPNGFAPAIVLNRSIPLRKRPCKRPLLLPLQRANEYKRIHDSDVIFDLGKETVGYLSFEFISPCRQEITVAYGEHLIDGCVRRKIDSRDFSISYKAKAGKNRFMGPFLRLAGRYLEFHSEAPLSFETVGIIPSVYPLREQLRPPLSPQQNAIYDLCIETLKLCMHDHYEDCPWREQALYALDSRNQMLCGYYAFKEYEFPRANLELFAEDRRADGLLSICAPTRNPLAIPSFSLHYITACLEYGQHSGDWAFLKTIYPKLCSITETFIKRIKNGLIYPFNDANHWNFYEWSTGLIGKSCDPNVPELPLNALLSMALAAMATIAEHLEIPNDYRQQAAALNRRINETFWNGSIYTDRPQKEQASQLGNALAILCGAADQSKSKELCKRLNSDSTLTPITLSMACFKFDALLKTDRKQYAPLILKEIERIYQPMIDFGSTTVWETEGGAEDFGGAGSLCHGWSAMPIYYYHILNEGDINE